jgi:hypothetical protein
MNKKITFSILAVFFIVTVGKTQQLPPNNSNILNTNLNKFVGLWRHVNGADTIVIFLKKENVLLPTPQNWRADVLVGYHFYKKGNLTIESSFNDRHLPADSNKCTFYGGTEISTAVINTATGNFHDISKNYHEEFKLTINSAQTQIACSLRTSSGIRITNRQFTGFTMPTSFVLTKL